MLSELRSEETAERRRVLVVDDDRDFAESLRNFLTLEGYEVEMAHSAERAREAIGRFDAQVAILDYRLGATIGTDLVKPLTAHRPGLICLLATAYADMDTAVKALRLGIYDYFGKPLNTDDLLATLERCFEKIRLEQEKKAAVAALHDADKMKAIARMAGGVAHHFNNLLMVILANTERLKLCVEGDHFARTLTDELERAVDSAAEINMKLLTYTRQNISRPEAIAVDAVISETAETLAPELGESIRIESVAGDDLWLVHAQPVQFRSTLLAILRNGMEATTDGGTLTIEAANVVMPDFAGSPGKQQSDGAYVMISVTDRGTGMAPDVAERAFEPFYTQKGLAKNLGLGLSTAQGFAVQSGGRITIDSEEGRGTTVQLYLPRWRARGSEDSKA